jgi:predicted PurR-regulated permease PerM
MPAGCVISRTGLEFAVDQGPMGTSDDVAYTAGVSRFFLDSRTARVTWTILVILATLALAYAVRWVLLLVALSLFFAYLLFPLVRLVERWLTRRRTLAIAVVYLVVLAALGGAGAAVGPRLTTEVQSLAQKLPEMSKGIQSGEIVGSLLHRRGWEWRQVTEIEALIRTHMGEIISYAQHVTAALLKWLAGAWVIVLIPVFAFFILKDAERFTSATLSRLRHRGYRGTGWAIAEDLHLLLGQYVRAQLLLALITFVAWSAVFLTAGVPYALVLAGIGGALEFIPVIGPLTAGVLAIGVSLFGGYAHPWLLAGFVLVWRGIQDYACVPLIMGRGIEIHPALVIVGVLAGGEIAGVAGMFLSVPVIAAARIVWRRLRTDETRPVDDRSLDGSVTSPRWL